MLELSGEDPSAMRLAFGGDALNTCVYLARLGVPVAFVTALGDDPFSGEMIAEWIREGIDTSAVLRVSGKLPGLYVIRTDARGERSFHFWREASAARGCFAAPNADVARDALRDCDVLLLSLIGLSILPREAQEELVSLARAHAARGRRVAFDSNFRPSAWPDVARARTLIDMLLPAVHFALPTLEDEQRLHGDADAPACARRLLARGVREVAVKHGANGAWIESVEEHGQWIAPRAVVEPIDTTGAGDAFNAGYLAARLAGRRAHEAASRGNALAMCVIRHRGAIVPRSAMPRGELEPA
jgi:2-dehydro-3-deoxygluconokinase